MVRFTNLRTLSRFLFPALFLLLILPSSLTAQPSEIPFHKESYRLESGRFDGGTIKGEEAVNVFTGTVELNAVPWIQLFFGDANLGTNSYLIITSLHDGYWQKLDAVSIEQWQYFSAFFNGGVVEIALYVAPFDRDIFFYVEEVGVGDWVNGFPIESQCGPTDDRISSNQPATSRLVSIGCTAWIIPNGHFVSAGHCLGGSSSHTVEFQVPPSLPGGTIQHPGPEDQYSVDASTKVFVDGGVGNDWGTFEVFPNSITGLMPKDAQGAYWPLVQDLGPDSIRITGYGVDTGVDNQTQQTHVGPNAGSSGTTMRYVTDTEGGNSGSPVIDALTGNAVGVHTHGGCSTSGTGNNNGTSLFHPDFWAAVDMGAGGCPVEAASNPNPVAGATNISINLSELSWSNGAGALTNELYFGTDPGSMSLMQSGSLATSWTITGVTFNYETDYFWQVVEIGDSCDTFSPVWSFTTVIDPAIVLLFMDDFEAGPGNWNITTVSGCPWAIFPASDYTLPPTATGNAMAADADACGSAGGGSTGDITLITAIDATMYQTVWVEFDNDWQAIDVDDFAMLDVSVDGGATWTNVLTFDVIDIRNTHEVWDITAMAATSNVLLRFVSIQPGWDWWWAIDNVAVYGSDPIPVELTSFAATVSDESVTLNWSTATETNNQGFEVQRSTDNQFTTIGFVNGFGTSTEIHNYSYVDASVEVGTYTYRLKQVDYDGTFEYSDVVEVEVIAPDVFSLEQNYPNPFNPSTMIKFSLAADSKVSLTVFDVLGQEVSNLISGNLAAGLHEINFNASNINSGVYFYRINATGVDGTNFTSVKKMILTK